MLIVCCAKLEIVLAFNVVLTEEIRKITSFTLLFSDNNKRRSRLIMDITV